MAILLSWIANVGGRFFTSVCLECQRFWDETAQATKKHRNNSHKKAHKAQKIN